MRTFFLTALVLTNEGTSDVSLFLNVLGETDASIGLFAKVAE